MATQKFTSPEQVRQVAFLRIGAVGDIMVATASLQHTLERFPNAKVWVIGPAFWGQVLLPSRWPRVNGIIVTSDRKTDLGEMYRPEPSTDQWLPTGERSTLFDFLKSSQAFVNLRHESLRYAWPAWRARLPFRLGTCWWGLKWLFTHWEPWLGKDPIIHERDRLLRISAASPWSWFKLGFTRANRRALKHEQTLQNPDLKVDKLKPFQPGQDPSSVAYKWQKKVLPALKEPNAKVAQALSGLERNSYVLINPTGSRRDKAWEAIRFKQLCERLKPWLLARNLKILIVGAPSETAWLREIATENFSIAQPKDLRDLMDLVGCAKALVTTASSMQFFANALNIPTLTIMGRTYPARWGPLSPRDKIICGQFADASVVDMYQQDIVAYSSISVDQVENGFYEWFANL